MFKFIVGAVAAAAVAVLAPVAPAQATITEEQCHAWDYATPVRDALCFPLPNHSTVVVQGVKYMWGIRPLATDVDRATGLTIISAVGVRCIDFPEAYCITVRKTALPPDRAGEFRVGPGETYTTGGWENGTILLSRTYLREPMPIRKHIAGHEFLHALGFTHHNGAGLCTWKYLYTRPSAAEWRALTSWYTRP